jgi:hypothetical protein
VDAKLYNADLLTVIRTLPAVALLLALAVPRLSAAAESTLLRCRW